MAIDDYILRATQQQNVLRNIAEDIKLPLLRILAEVQVSKLSGTMSHDSVETTIDAVMRLLDSYILTTQVYNGQLELGLEPVAVSAVMQDSAEYLNKYAQLQGCKLEVVAPSRKSVVAMANKPILQAALICLGYSFLNITKNSRQQHVIKYIAERRQKNIVTSIFSSQANLSTKEFDTLRNLAGYARQPLPNFSHTSSSGLYIADALFNSMQTSLNVKRHKFMSGISANLLSSQQLALL